MSIRSEVVICCESKAFNDYFKPVLLKYKEDYLPTISKTEEDYYIIHFEGIRWYNSDMVDEYEECFSKLNELESIDDTNEAIDMEGLGYVMINVEEYESIERNGNMRGYDTCGYEVDACVKIDMPKTTEIELV